jgi:AAHS family 4-hydroxybenzoate transporter-like MFS transporter
MPAVTSTVTAFPIRPIQVDSLLDGRPKPLQLLVFIACAMVALFDGMDSQAIGVAGKLMAGDLHMPMSRFAPAISSGLLGATIGAMAFGTVADRFGRKPTLVFATALFGLFTVLTAIPSDFTWLIVLRFIAGLGLGGATPCFITLSAEFAPPRHRATMTALLWAAYPLGNAVGGFTSAFVIGHATWHMVFLVAGIPTLALAVFMAFFMPESLRYLVVRHPARAERLARRLDKSISTGPIRLILQGADDLVASHAGTAERTGLLSSLKALFSDGRGVGTLLLWLILYCSFATTTVMVVMSPTLLTEAGFSLQFAGNLVGLFSVMATISMAVAGKLLQKLGPVLALAPFFLVGGLLLASLGSLHEPWVLALCMSAIGLTVPLAAAGAIALTAMFYPTEIRSSGVGWGMGFGRFGQVLSPLAMGLMLGLHWHPDRISMVMALAPLIASVAVLFCARALAKRAQRQAG